MAKPKADENADNGTSLSTQDWLDVARETLIREGIDAVKIDRLAKSCNVTRGGFYWRFKSRQDLLDQLLEDWKARNTGPFLAALSGSGSPSERYRALISLWIDEREFLPDYDTAVRNWAVLSPKVAEAVHTVDALRIEALRQLFTDAGYDGDEALVRARITYYHQVGYYTLGMKQTAERRRQLMPIYYSILTGFDEKTYKSTPSPKRSSRAAAA